ncbi:serine hydrolase domain-containing protein [Catellatospora tritici]|uniref:serine hydrolase domain-containing protein n=1 Tax=Catellatospora tritici TaxID=2851566 RepID=UPI001C2D8B50|nr:serine hydrolase domain-containing protein [Catellatospora tritici]MBV1852965.1 beta-lactamase family protein [Catellatospora tritici]
MKTWHIVASLAAAVVLTLTVGLSPSRGAPADQCPQLALGFTERQRADLARAATYTRDSAQLPGLIAAVFVPGRGAWVCVLGVSDLETGHPLNAADRFRIASITKTFTGTAVLQLADRGELRLDDPLSRWVDWPDGNAITIRQLLNMTSGVYSYTDDPQFIQRYNEDPEGAFTARDALDIARAHDPYFAPGAGFHYSDTNYILLEQVVEKITGRPIADWIDHNILDPLHLTNTSYPATSALPAPFSRGYDAPPPPQQAVPAEPEPTQQPATPAPQPGTPAPQPATPAPQPGTPAPQPAPSPQPGAAPGAAAPSPSATPGPAATGPSLADLRDVTYSNPNYAGAAGAMVSNLADLRVWAKALAEGSLLSETMRRERLRTVPLAANAGVSYGLGIADWGGWLGHNGTILGYNAAMFYDPKTGSVIIVETNRSSLTSDVATPLFTELAKTVPSGR